MLRSMSWKRRHLGLPRTTHLLPMICTRQRPLARESVLRFARHLARLWETVMRKTEFRRKRYLAVSSLMTKIAPSIRPLWKVLWTCCDFVKTVYGHTASVRTFSAPIARVWPSLNTWIVSGVNISVSHSPIFSKAFWDGFSCCIF